MTVPYYMSETKSDMRGIKHGWYAIEDDGTLYSGPFPASRNAPRESHLYRHPTLRAASGGSTKTAL
jgi:hypothetical protein